MRVLVRFGRILPRLKVPGEGEDQNKICALLIVIEYGAIAVIDFDPATKL